MTTAMETVPVEISPFAFRAGTFDVSHDVLQEAVAEAPVPRVRPEWIGTSQFSTPDNIQLQHAGHLDTLISYRESLVNQMTKEPYNPAHYIGLCRCDTTLGFSDIAAANAHRAIILIEAALCKKSEFYDARRLCIPVQKTVIAVLRTTSPAIILHELKNVYLKAYRELLTGLLDTAAFWDGLLIGKVTRKKSMFPKDLELKNTISHISNCFLQRNRELQKQECEGDDLVMKSRQGKVFQKVYPWLAAELHWRTPSLIRGINTNLGAGNCEIKPVVFGPATESPAEPKEGADMGPLGIFAKRDITEDEIIMVDDCLTGSADISPTTLKYCDTCHACLEYPFAFELKIRKPSCCNKVAFCSDECQERACGAMGYHTVLCGKDIEWVFAGINMKTSTSHTRWRPTMFMRIASIIIAARRATPPGQKPIHPLQHPIMAVMTANYAAPDKLQPEYPSDWQFFENVQAPTRILLQLGVDIFTESDWSPEVIQTIYWRMENNGNMSHFNPKLELSCMNTGPKLEDGKKATPTNLLEAEIAGRDSEGTIHMHALNTNYLFLNHSCDPNCTWHGCNPLLDDPLEWYEDANGKLVKFGSSAVFVKAARDIKASEELKISYIGDPLCVKGSVNEEERKARRAAKKLWMEKWFQGGCGCVHCESEKVEALGVDTAKVVEETMQLVGAGAVEAEETRGGEMMEAHEDMKMARR